MRGGEGEERRWEKPGPSGLSERPISPGQKGDQMVESLSDVRTPWIRTEKGVLWVSLGAQVNNMVMLLKESKRSLTLDKS